MVNILPWWWGTSVHKMSWAYTTLSTSISLPMATCNLVGKLPYRSTCLPILPEAVCCCLLVNHVVYKHVTMTSLLIPTHPENFKCFVFELWVSNEKKNHSPIDIR